MSYPKPLSERSLEKLYAQAGLSIEARDFLHSLFAACANLYGAIALRDVWSIYQKLKSDAPRVHRREFVAFSAIVRRETQPYQIYEIEELYTEEPHNDLDRHIISKELIGIGYGKMSQFYTLMDERSNCPYCVPDNFLSYAIPTIPAEERMMLDFIGGLRSTAKECKPQYGKAYPNENLGKRLNEFSFLNISERFDIEYYKNKPAIYHSLLADYSGTEAEKIVRLYRRAENIGYLRTTEVLQYVTDELYEAGVRLTRSQFERLVQRMMVQHNESRLWCTCGWKPQELADAYSSNGVPSISFGPGLQKAFADGTINKGQLVQKIKEMGLKVDE